MLVKILLDIHLTFFAGKVVRKRTHFIFRAAYTDMYIRTL